MGAAIVAQAMAPVPGSRPDQLMLAARALALVRAVAAGSTPSSNTIGDYLARTLVVLPERRIRRHMPISARSSGISLPTTPASNSAT